MDMWRRSYDMVACMIGTIVAYANSTLPDGLLPCNGSTFERDDYPDLYDALHSDYHVSSTQFTTPDLRDQFVVGAGNDYALGATRGENQHTLTTTEIPSHTHAYYPPVLNLDLESPGAPDIQGAGISPVTAETFATGGGSAHENRPPFYALVWAIVAR